MEIEPKRGRSARRIMLLRLASLVWIVDGALGLPTSVGGHSGGDRASVSTSSAPKARPFLFIHISKTGGTSVDAALGMITVLNKTAECADVPVMERRFLKHDTAATARSYYNASEWERAYKFALVRNPWDRLVSWWAMHATPPATSTVCGCDGSLAAVGTPQDDGAPENVLLPEGGRDPSVGNASYLCSFTYYFENCLEKTRDEINGTNFMDWTNQMEEPGFVAQMVSLEDPVARSMHAAQLDVGHALVDSVGRTENLTAHFVKCSTRLEPAACALAIAQLSLTRPSCTGYGPADNQQITSR